MSDSSSGSPEKRTRQERFKWVLIIPVLEKLMNPEPTYPNRANDTDIVRIQSHWIPDK